MIPFPDGSEFRINSSNFQVRITPEYYNLSLVQSGSSIQAIDATDPAPVSLSLEKVSENGVRSTLSSPISLEIFDDISGSFIYSGSTSSPIPNEIVKKV